MKVQATLRQRFLAHCGATLLVAASVASGGCKAVFDYPNPSGEGGQARCSNGTDDDFDGAIDCDDPDCDGFCAEQDQVRCADGRDNDGDGLTDARDPRCWHLVGPTALRCASADPVDFEEHFDAVLADSRWLVFGDPGGETPALVAPLQRSPRSDQVLGFSPSSDPDIESGLSSTMLFDGDWSSFELGFAGLVDGGQLQVMLVPAELAPKGGPLLEGAVASSVAIRFQPSGQVTMFADGAERSVGAAATGAWHSVRLTREGESLALSLDGEVMGKTAAPPLTSSRLVVSGTGGIAQLDDLYLRIAGRSPCGAWAPQIPACGGCAKDASLYVGDVGWTVSVARDDHDGSFCALTTEGEVGTGAADRGRSWLSSRGVSWTPGGELEVGSEGVAWSGASVARDAASSLWRAIVLTTGADATAIHRLSSPDCVDWTLEGSLPLPDGAHSPTYLLPGIVSPHELYFFLAPTPGEGPVLSRYRSDDGETFFTDDALARFPAEAEVESPISLSRAGPRDVILTHRIAPESGILGLGVWVAQEDDLSTWHRASTFPLVRSEPARGGFDARSVASGTIFWSADAAFALYGARGQPIWELFRPGAPDSLSASVAALVPAGASSPLAPFSEAPQSNARPGSCGNSTCEQGEDCSTCATDCGVCDGHLLVSDSFDDDQPWSLESGPGEEPSAYVSPFTSRMILAPGSPAWMVRELPDIVVGDFELSFDAHWIAPEGAADTDRCPALVGLAKASDTERVAEGVFAQLDQQLLCQPGVPAFSSHVRVGPSRFPSLRVNKTKRTCQGVSYGYREAWHHVTLRRQSGEVSLRVSSGRGCAGAETGRVVSAYGGPIDAFDGIAIGWGREGWNETCSIASAGLNIDNLTLRGLPCPDGGELCNTACVDLSSSPEHCGSCDVSVDAGERCEAGKPTCAGQLCPVGTQGVFVCVDTDSSPSHCGGCGRAVGPLEACRDGIPVAAMVTVPDGFSIDATEVTVGQYEAWRATDPTTSDQPPLCAWNDTFEAKCPAQSSEAPDNPMTCVDWCDAYAYCASVGKRLCGGKNGPGNWQFLRACAGGSEGNDFPYGDEFDPLACNGSDSMHTGSPLQCAPIRPVASLPSCQSSVPGYEGIYDLSGNAYEWIDDCTGDSCRRAGGSTCHYSLGLACTAATSISRAETWANGGFRCCSK